MRAVLRKAGIRKSRRGGTRPPRLTCADLGERSVRPEAPVPRPVTVLPHVVALDPEVLRPRSRRYHFDDVRRNSRDLTVDIAACSPPPADAGVIPDPVATNPVVLGAGRDRNGLFPRRRHDALLDELRRRDRCPAGHRGSRHAGRFQKLTHGNVLIAFSPWMEAGIRPLGERRPAGPIRPPADGTVYPPFCERTTRVA